MNNIRKQFSDGFSATQTGVAYNEGLRKYMLGVYNYMGLGIAATALVAMVFVQNPELTMLVVGNPLGVWLPFIAILGIGWVGPKIIFSGSQIAAHGIYWAYVAVWGLLIGPYVGIYAGAGMANIVYEAFFITAALFGALSLWGYTTKKELSGWGTFLGMAVMGLLIAIVANALIFKNGMMSVIISSLVVLVFSAVTAYQTQSIKRLYADGHEGANARASIFGAFSLYGTFATLFLHILNLLSRLRGN
jgi:uncharacterized protein